MFLFLMPLLVAVDSFALSEARLIGQSKSGQTALFNLGSNDSVKEGDYALIVKEIRNLNERNLRLVPVAKAKNIKVTTQNSVWILFKILDAELLVRGEPYLILTESQMLSGRRDPRIGRISVITEKDKASFQTQMALTDDNDRIAKLKQRYPEVEVMHVHEEKSENDLDLYDVESWKKNQRDRYRTALYKSPYQMDFKRQLRLATFEKIVTAYLKQVNDPAFNYEKFYELQMKDQFSNEFRKKITMDNEYESYLNEQTKKATENAKLYRSILDRGESWSEDFSDEELKVLLNQVSVLKEKDRRIYIQADPKRYTAYFNFGLNLTDEQTTKDQSYKRENGYSVDGEIEVTPFLKHESLERFTLTGSFRFNQTAFESSLYNSRVNEFSLAGGINWFPIYPPYVIDAPLIFLGAHIRSGSATAEAPALNDKSSYTVLVIPGIRTGMKYNLRNDVGLRIAIGLEKLQFERYNKNKGTSVLPDNKSVLEAKINFAFAYSF